MSEQESRVCIHGSLRRSCEPCDLADRLEEAEATIAFLRGALAALGSESIALTFDEWGLAKLTADQRMKASNGHSFMTIMKTRCQFCGRSQRARGRCGMWFQTFLANLDNVLLNLPRERLSWEQQLKELE